MNKKYFFLLLFCICCIFKMQAQDIRDDSNQNFYSDLTEYNTVLKYYPTGMLSINFPNFQFGIQQKLGKRFYTEIVAGYVTTFDGKWRKPWPIEGIILRAEGTFAIYKSNGNAIHLGLQGIYKNATEKPTEEFSRFNGAYQQFIQYKIEREQIIGNFIFLYHIKIGEHWLLELGGGNGVRYNYRVDSGIPADAETLEEQEFFNFDREGKNSYPSFHLRIGIGVNIGGNQKSSIP